MAPKNKDAKGTKGAAESSGNILRKPICMAIAVIFTLLLILAAAGSIGLYFAEEKKHEDDRKGLELLRDFIIGNNESLKDKSDLYMIHAAYRFMDQLKIVRDKNIELKTITAALKKERDWFTAGTIRLLFLDKPLNWYEAKNECVKRKGLLAIIIGEEVEIFIERKAKEKQRTFWFGLSTNSTGRWFWITGPEAKTTYWEPGKPHPYASGFHCGALRDHCADTRCWLNMYCFNAFPAICMRERDPQWM